MKSTRKVGAPSAATRRSTPIQRQSLAAAVAERLREQILNGDLHEGQQLRQDTIANVFQVSRIPVREAFLRLEAEGLVKVITNRGAVVSALSLEEIQELFEIRAVLECHILRQAIPNLTTVDFQKAEEILKEYTQAVEQEFEIATWGELNWRFHSTLYEAAKRPMLMSLLKTLNSNCGRYTRLHLLVTRNLHRAGKAHRVLLTVCRTRDADQSCEVLWQHIMEAGQYLKDFIRSRREQHEHA